MPCTVFLIWCYALRIFVSPMPWRLLLICTHPPSAIKCMTHIRREDTQCPMNFAHRCLWLKTCLNFSVSRCLNARVGRLTIFSVHLLRRAEKKAIPAISQQATETVYNLLTTALKSSSQELNRPMLWTRKLFLKLMESSLMIWFRSRLFRATVRIIFRVSRV